jgi:hypothetical protein
MSTSFIFCLILVTNRKLSVKFGVLNDYADMHKQ